MGEWSSANIRLVGIIGDAEWPPISHIPMNMRRDTRVADSSLHLMEAIEFNRRTHDEVE